MKIFVTVDGADLRVTGYEVIDTHGEVTNITHDGQKCARAAVEDLVNRVLDGR